MINRTNYKKHLIWVLLLYGLLITLLDLDYNSVFFDEALNIVAGRQVLSGQFCPGCLYFMGSVMVHPILAATGDSIGGLNGARIVSLLFGMGIIIIIYMTGRVLFNIKTGLIAATLFLFSGTTQYLMKLASYDTVGAFFLSTGALLVFVAVNKENGGKQIAALLGAALFLFLASITKYVLPVFIPPLLVYLWIRLGLKKTFIFTVLPILGLLVLFFLFAPYAPKGEVLEHLRSSETTVHVDLLTLADWTFRWIALAYLLSVFGMFHEKKGKTAILLFALSTPIIILHMVTRVEQSINKNVIYSLIFLAPATALGVDHIGNLFSMRSENKVIRNFFTIAVIVISWAYGMYNLRWLERQYPDMDPVIEFFQEKGFDGMTIATNGWGEVIYTYSLGDKYPNASFVQINEAVNNDGNVINLNRKPDFIVCEDPYYGKRCPCEDYSDYMKDDYTVLKEFEFDHPWGTSIGTVFGRR